MTKCPQCNSTNIKGEVEGFWINVNEDSLEDSKWHEKIVLSGRCKCKDCLWVFKD